MKSCWTCRHQRIAGAETFLGKCGYFEKLGQPVKDIPPNVVDIGCKHWEEKIDPKP